MNFYNQVMAVAKRDSLRANWLKRTAIGYLWMLFMFGVSLAIGGGFDTFIDFSKYGRSYSQFLTSGFIAYFIAMWAVQTGANLILDQDGFQRLFLVTPISTFAILLGTEWTLIMGQLFFMLVIVILFLIFQTGSLINLFLLFLFSSFVSTIFLSLGIWLSTVFDSVKTSQQVIGWLNVVWLFLSGMMFPIQAMPVFLQKLFLFNPLTYVVDIIRFLMTGEHQLPFINSFLFLGIFGIISIFFGTFMYDRNLRK